jgi:FXSXX-COOH protein
MSEGDDPAIETDLADLSGIDLADLRLDRPVLERCIRRLVREADDTWRPIAGFDAHI